ncbi:MAG: zinc ABC transporter substrate-binding protein [Eubacteriales bacterium]|nr:zinc ABC transporter substrate-binding protein [Eubacteriales bacterium]
MSALIVKKWKWALLAVFLAALLAFPLILSGNVVDMDDTAQSICVYSTFGPLYALSEMIFANVPDIEHHLLVQPQDGCLRNYVLSDWDLYQVAYNADLVIAGGRGLESFETTLESLGETGPAVAKLMYNMELYQQGDESASDAEESHLLGANPYAYMSCEAAEDMLSAIAGTMMELDPRFADLYAQNLENTLHEMDALQSETHAIAGNLSGKRVILFNEAMIYPVQEFDLEVAYWYDRESGTALYENELEDCLAALEEVDARVVLLELQAPASLVNALEEAGYVVAKLNVMTAFREDMGAEAYFSAQRDNAAALNAAFLQAEGE